MLIKIKYGRYINRCVRTHESDFEVTVRRLGKILQRTFLLNLEPAFAEPLGNGLERLAFEGLFYFYRKLSPLRFLPGLLRFAPTNFPWISEDGKFHDTAKFRARFAYSHIASDWSVNNRRNFACVVVCTCAEQ